MLCKVVEGSLELVSPDGAWRRRVPCPPSENIYDVVASPDREELFFASVKRVDGHWSTMTKDHTIHRAELGSEPVRVSPFVHSDSFVWMDDSRRVYFSDGKFICSRDRGSSEIKRLVRIHRVSQGPSNLRLKRGAEEFYFSYWKANAQRVGIADAATGQLLQGAKPISSYRLDRTGQLLGMARGGKIVRLNPETLAAEGTLYPGLEVLIKRNSLKGLERIAPWFNPGMGEGLPVVALGGERLSLGVNLHREPGFPARRAQPGDAAADSHGVMLAAPAPYSDWSVIGAWSGGARCVSMVAHADGSLAAALFEESGGGTRRRVSVCGVASYRTWLDVGYLPVEFQGWEGVSVERDPEINAIFDTSQFCFEPGGATN